MPRYTKLKLLMIMIIKLKLILDSFIFYMILKTAIVNEAYESSISLSIVQENQKRIVQSNQGSRKIVFKNRNGNFFFFLKHSKYVYSILLKKPINVLKCNFIQSLLSKNKIIKKRGEIGESRQGVSIDQPKRLLQYAIIQ